MLDNSVIDPAAGRLHYSNESQCHLLATVNQHHVIPRTLVRYVCAVWFFFFCFLFLNHVQQCDVSFVGVV